MMNVMDISGVKAVIAFDPEIAMFRGEFVGLNGGADFYATDIEGLRREGAASLKAFFEMCAEEGVSPYKKLPADSLCAFLRILMTRQWPWQRRQAKALMPG